MRRTLGRALALGAALAALGIGAMTAAVLAQTATTIPMQPTGSANAGLSGQVVITPVGANQVKVDITVNGLAPNSAHAAHIHSPGTQQGACDTGGPVVYPFTDVQADGSGKGTSSNTVTFDASKGIPTRGWYVNVHQMASSAGTGAGIICAPIAATLGSAPAATGGAAPTGGGAAPSAAPATGTGSMAHQADNRTLIAGLALAGVLFAGAGLVLVRRRA